MSLRKSVTPDFLICLEDGKKFKSLRRHLAGLGLTPEQYREKWKLPSDYPMVAPNYAAQRSALAKADRTWPVCAESRRPQDRRRVETGEDLNVAFRGETDAAPRRFEAAVGRGMSVAAQDQLLFDPLRLPHQSPSRRSQSGRRHAKRRSSTLPSPNKIRAFLDVGRPSRPTAESARSRWNSSASLRPACRCKSYTREYSASCRTPGRSASS